MAVPGPLGVHMERLAPPPPSNPPRLYNDLGSSAVYAKPSDKEEKKMVDLYNQIHQAIQPARASNDFTIDFEYSTVIYTDAATGGKCEKELSELTKNNPELAAAVQKMKGIVERVWGDKIRTPTEYAPGRKGTHRGAQHHRANDPVLQNLPKKAEKAALTVGKPIKSARQRDLLYKRMAAAENLVSSQKGAVKKQIDALEKTQKTTDRELKKKRTKSLSSKKKEALTKKWQENAKIAR